jgi:hypothetical protein
LTLNVRILPFLTTFAQLSARLKNFLGGWLLVLGIKEGLVECATVCIKSVVILIIFTPNTISEIFFFDNLFYFILKIDLLIFRYLKKEKTYDFKEKSAKKT